MITTVLDLIDHDFLIDMTVFSVDQEVRTKLTHPYSYDPVVQLSTSLEGNRTVYSDRLLRGNYKQYRELLVKHFQNQGDYWNGRKPSDIEAFLRDYLNSPSLILTRVEEHCNQATGFPVWRFDYFVKDKNEP